MTAKILKHFTVPISSRKSFVVALNTISKNSVASVLTVTTKLKILHITSTAYLFIPFHSYSKQALFSYTTLPKSSYGHSVLCGLLGKSL